MDLLAELNAIFRGIFEDPTIEINRETTADDVDGWDSMTHVNLIFEIENRYDIRFSLSEVEQLKNVGDMVSLLESYLEE
jgi:acyl carrier protein